MRYYKTMRAPIGNHTTSVEQEMQKVQSQYPRTFQIHRISHLVSGSMVILVATFSWDDVEDNWKKEPEEKDYKNYRLDSVIPPPPFDYRATWDTGRPQGEEKPPATVHVV